MSRRLVSTLTTAAALATLTPTALVLTDATAAAPGARLSVENGSSECWGRDGTATLWHFIVFNEGNKAGRYRVAYRRQADDELTTYTDRVPKRQGINDGLVIPAGESIHYIRVSEARSKITLFLRSDVTGLARCSRD